MTTNVCDHTLSRLRATKAVIIYDKDLFVVRNIRDDEAFRILYYANKCRFTVFCFVRRTKSSKNYIIIITDLIWAKNTFVSPYGKETMKTIQLGYGVLHVILHHQLET